MDNAETQELISLGQDIMAFKYIALAGTTVVIWDHLLTLSDEIKYIWGRRSSALWLFILSRYSILLYKTWDTIDSQSHSGQVTRKKCNRTVKIEGYYFVLIITLGQIFLTMRIYALTGASKYVVVAYTILVVSSLVTGLWLVSVPSSTALQLPVTGLEVFRACMFTASDAAEWAYRSQVALSDLIAFVCLVAFVLNFKSDHGQLRMTRLMRTILQDGTLYFFVMAAFHIAFTLSIFFASPFARGFLPNTIIVLIPVMISRLVISLRKAVGSPVVQAWDRVHFSTVVDSGPETTNSAGIPLSPMVFSPFSFRSPPHNPDSRRSRSHVASSVSDV